MSGHRTGVIEAFDEFHGQVRRGGLEVRLVRFPDPQALHNERELKEGVVRKHYQLLLIVDREESPPARSSKIASSRALRVGFQPGRNLVPDGRAGLLFRVDLDHLFGTYQIVHTKLGIIQFRFDQGGQNRLEELPLGPEGTERLPKGQDLLEQLEKSGQRNEDREPAYRSRYTREPSALYDAAAM